jgi:hypothetical protein
LHHRDPVWVTISLHFTCMFAKRILKLHIINLQNEC